MTKNKQQQQAAALPPVYSKWTFLASAHCSINIHTYMYMYVSLSQRASHCSTAWLPSYPTRLLVCLLFAFSVNCLLFASQRAVVLAVVCDHLLEKLFCHNQFSCATTNQLQKLYLLSKDPSSSGSDVGAGSFKVAEQQMLRLLSLNSAPATSVWCWGKAFGHFEQHRNQFSCCVVLRCGGLWLWRMG